MALDPEELQGRKMRRSIGMTIRGELGLTEGTGWWIDKRIFAFVSSEPFRPGGVIRARCDFGRELIDLDLRIVRQLDKQWAPRGQRGVPHVARYRLVDKAHKRDLKDGIRRVNPRVFGDEEPGSTSGSRSVASGSRPSTSGAPSGSGFAFKDREDHFRARNEEVKDGPSDHAWATLGSEGAAAPTKRPTKRDDLRSAMRKAAGEREAPHSSRGIGPAKPAPGSMAAKVERRRKKRAARLRASAQEQRSEPSASPELHSTAASVSRAGGPPTVFVAFETLELARRSLKASGNTIWCAVGDDGSVGLGDDVLLVLQLPNQVYLQLQAKVSAQGGGSLTLVAASANSDATLLAAILS